MGEGERMMNKITAAIAMLGLIAAAGLDSENWLPALGITAVSFGWVAIYGLLHDRWME